MTTVTIRRAFAIEMSDLEELTLLGVDGDRNARVFNTRENASLQALDFQIQGRNLRLDRESSGQAQELNFIKFSPVIAGGTFEDFQVPASQLFDVLVTGDTEGFISLLLSGDDEFVLADILNTPLFVDGGPGDDWLNLDAARGSASTTPVDVDLRAGTTDFGVSFQNFEAVMGTIGDDTLRGSGGDDTLAGNFGNDRLIGRAGDDWADYSRTTVAVDRGIEADLGRGIVRKDGLQSPTEEDRLKSIEGLIGTLEDDRMRGDGGTNYFAGLGGEDLMAGAGGDDWAVYAFDAENGGADGVQVDLRRKGAIDGFGDQDVLRGIENVLGTDSGDIIAGNGRDNVLVGGEGRDTLIGRNGDDTFVFRDGDKRDRIKDFTQGEDTIDLTLASVDSFDDLGIRTQGGNAIVKWDSGGTFIILEGVRGNALTEDDFIF